MNAGNEPLHDILERIESRSEAALVVTSVDAPEWPAAIFQGLAATGILVTGPPATAITCPACGDDHTVDVEVAGGIEALPYIFCRSEGVVPLRPDDLATWRLRAAGIAEALHAQLDLAGPVREREIGRAWSLGKGRIRKYVDVWLVRGATWPDANSLLARLRLPANAWVFTTGRAGGVMDDQRLLPLADYASCRPEGLVVDLAQVATAVASTGQPAPPPYEFRREGELWHIRFENRSLPPLRPLKGLADIQFLLSRPGVWVPAALLDGGTGVFQSGMETADGNTVRALRAALVDDSLEAVEREKLLHHLGSIKGKFSLRTQGKPSEQARGRVAHRLPRALKTISRHDPALAAFLKAHIRTGHDLMYDPPQRPPNWVLE